MIGIILTGHGSFPKGIYDSIKLITGDIKQIELVSFEDDVERLEEDLKFAISQVDSGSGVVCFSDLAGGTPFNVSSRLASKSGNVRVIGGTNLPMFLVEYFKEM